MKTQHTILIFMLLCSMTLVAQENDEIRTLFGNNHSNGGYGSFSVRYGTIDENNYFSNGGRGGWIINHVFTLGGGGYGFVSQDIKDQNLDGNLYNITGGYGGLLLEVAILPKFPVHLSFPVLTGAGGITYVRRSLDYAYERSEAEAPFFVVEPGVELELNMLSFMHIGVGVYYRYTTPIKLQYDKDRYPLLAGQNIITTNALESLSYGITFKFGKF